MAHQWYFPILRIRGQVLKAARLSGWHKFIGALAPLLFYLHSQVMGYAYLAWLSTTFFALFVTGLCNPEATGVQRPWFRVAWLSAHAGLATALPFLVVFHVFTSYAFK